MQWGDRWAWPDGTGPVRVLHGECGHEARVEVRCPHCERALAPSDRARRGAERARGRRARAGRARTPVGAPARREPGAAGRVLAAVDGY